MSSDEEIVRRLRATFPGRHQQPVEFRPPTWQPWLSRFPAARDALDALGADRASAEISRSQLREMAAGSEARDEDAQLRLFTAVMIWGSGTSNGRGPRNLAKALDHGPGAVLRASAELVDAGELAEAYRRFRLPGVGPAFATKWLWAVGTRRTTPPRPLILDSLVWKSLGALGWDSIERGCSEILGGPPRGAQGAPAPLK